MRDYTDIVNKSKKRKEKDVASTSSSAMYDATPIVERIKLEKSIGLDTFSNDFTKVNQTIQTLYGGWQTQETMNNTLATVDEMRNRLALVRKYKNKYAKDWDFDVDGAIDYYEKAIEGWGSQTELYKGFQNADAFDMAKTRAQFDEKYKGKTFDEIQSAITQVEEGSNEHSYLKGYTNYSNLEDFDKALAWAKGEYTNSEGKKANTEDKFKVFPSSIDEENVKDQLNKKYPKGNNILDLFPSLEGSKLSYPDESTVKNATKDIVAKEQAGAGVDPRYVQALERAKNVYKLDNGTNDYYAKYREEEDFEELSQYKSTKMEKSDKWYERLLEGDGQYGLGYGDITYEYINDVDGIRSEIKRKKQIYGADSSNTTTSQEKKGYDKLYPEEIAMYNYLYQKKGKESAQQYLDEMEVTLTKRVNKDDTENWNAFSDDHPILSSALSIPANIMGGVSGALESVTDAVQGKEYNPYGYYKTLSNYATTTRQNVGENIAEATEGMELLGTNVPSFLYQTGMSIGDTVVGGGTLGTLYSVVAGSSAFQQKAKELTEAGESQGVVVGNAMASGLAEMVFEYLSLDKLIKIDGVDGLRKGIKATLKQAGIEGSEELATELANIGADVLFRGDNNELAQLKKRLLLQGYSEEEANKQVWEQGIRQVAEAFAGGMVSGGVMGGGASIGNYAQNKSTGASIKANAQTETMWDTSAMTPEESETYKLYTEYANKGINAGNIKDAQLGNLYNTAESESYEALGSKKSKEVDKLNATTTLNALDKVSKPNTEELRKQRVESLSKGEVTEVTATGNSTKIEGIKKVDGDLVVTTSEGEFKADEITFSDNDAELLSYAENMEGEKANMFVSMYDGTASVDAYHDSFNLAVAYAENNISKDTMLENRGVLTPSQVGTIYTSIVTNKAKAQSSVIAKLMEKHGNTMSYNGTIDDSVIDYNNKTTDGSKVNWNSLTDSQRKGVTFLTGLAKATGLDAQLITDGLERGMNGAYMVENGKIIIDVYAGINKNNMSEDAKDTIIPALAHELTHWSKAKSPEKYQALSESIFKVLTKGGKGEAQLIDEEIVRLRKNGIKADVEYARDEIIARACEDLLSMSETGKEMFNNLSETEQKSLVAKIKDIINDLVNWVNELLTHYQSKSKEAEFLRQYKEDLQDISKQWDAMLKEAVAVNQAMKSEGVTDEAIINETLETIGLHYDAKTETVYHSYRSLEELFNMDDANDFLKTKEEYIQALMNATKRTKSECENYLNSLFLVHDLIGDDRARLDYESAINKSAWVSNSEYGGSIDFSTLCAKRRLFTGTMDAIIEQLPNTVLTDTDFLDIRNRLLAKELEAPCSMCYVEGSRAKNSEYINKWLTEYKKTNPKWIPQLADFTSTVRLEQTRLKHPEAYQSYQDAMNKLSQRKPKEASVRTDYKGEIRIEFKDGSSVDIKNKNGGIRFNSFSDFEIIHALDCMQVVTDMATVGLAGQGYTKVKEFAECFGNTGMKINLSLVAKGVDAKGNLIFDEVNGMKYQEAIDLRNKYSKNVGTVIVVFNNEQLKSALRDDSIDYVLPFHRSQWRKAQYVMMGLPTNTMDYTMHQNDRIRNPKTGRAVKLAKIKHVATYTNDITGETYEIKDNIMPNQYWDYSQDGVANANRYLDYINSNNMIPKFAFLLSKDQNGKWALPTDKDGNVTKEGRGYFKTLIDFKMYDNDGVGSPQTPVVPDFNMPYIREMLDNYTGGHESFPVAHDVVETFVSDYKKKHKRTQYSDRDSEGNQLTKEQVEYFEDSKVRDENGNLLVMYHGTQSDFTVFNPMLQGGKNGIAEGYGIYLTDNEKVANNYGGKIMRGYANITHPATIYKKSISKKDIIKLIKTLAETEAKEFVDNGDYTNLQDALKDTWVSNYVYTYEMSMDEAYRKVADVIRNGNENDMHIIQEVMLGIGVRDYASAYEFYDILKRTLGIDGFITEWTNGETNEKSEIAIAFDSNQFKNVDNLNPTENEDIRYSDRIESSVYEILGENDALKKRNEILSADIQRLRERVKLEGTVTKGKVFDANQLHGVAVYLNKTVNSAYNSKQLAKDLERLYSYIAQSENIDEHSLFAKCQEIARDILSEQRGEKVVDDYYKGILDDLRSRRISLSEEQINEVKSQYGDRYRNAFMGKITIAKDGISLDSVWQELSSMYPEVFDAETTEADQPLVLLEIYDSARESSVIYQKYNDSETTMGLATEIYNKYWTAPRVTTIADKYDAQIKKLNFEHRKAMSDLRTDFNDRLQKQKTADAIHYGKIINDLRKREKARVQEAREFGRRRVNDVKEKAEKNAKIQKITKNTKTLREWLVKNSKDKHISDELKEPVRDLISSIDYHTKRKDNLIDTSNYGNALAQIEENVEEAKKNVDLRATLTTLQLASAKDETLLRAGLDFSEDIENLTSSLSKINTNAGEYFVLHDMTLEDLNTLDKIVTQLKTVVTKTNQYYTMRRKQSITASAHELFDLFNLLGDAKESRFEGIANFFNYENITPVNFFDRLGDVGQDLFHSFVNAQSKMAFLKNEVQTFADRTWNGKDVKKWDNDLIEFEVIDAKKTRDITKPVYKKVYTTTSRLMTLYLHDQREQSREHLYKGGGGRFTTFDHKGKRYGEDVNGVVLTPQLVQHMLSKLDPNAKKVADAISDFLNNECKNWGNEITSDLYGVDLFLEEKYVPIEVIGESVSRTMEKPNRTITALLNKGFTKETKPNAKNQIVLDSIFDVFAKHTSEMMSYNAFAREVYDAVRLFEYKESRQTFVFNDEEGQTVSDNIQTAMKGSLGKGAVQYFRNFLEDINGTQQAGRGDNITGKLFSNFKLASVSWNLNVSMLQPLSYIRALTVIPLKHLVHGMSPFQIKDGISKAMKYSGLALWKSYGYYDTDISKGLAEQIKNSRTFADKLKEASMKIPEIADRITWGALWKSCEYYIADQNPNLQKGSDAFYEKVTDVFNDAICRTQVMDSVLTRSQIMRSKSMVVKGLTSFMAEPLTSYNMVYSVASQWHLDERSGNSTWQCVKKHGKKMAGAVAVYVLASVTESAIRTLTTKMRNAGNDDDDDEDEDVFLQQLLEQLNPLSKFPIGKEISSVMSGYGVSSIPGLNAIESCGNAVKQFKKMIIDGEEISYKKVYKILQSVSYLSGQGASNLYRDVIAMWNSTIGQAYPTLIISTEK